MALRPEITLAEKNALGKLIGEWRGGGPAVMYLAPSDPDRTTFEALTKRGGWVEKTQDGGYKITQYGMNAFYVGKLVKEAT